MERKGCPRAHQSSRSFDTMRRLLILTAFFAGAALIAPVAIKG
jgi:hypothetical protein